MFASLGRSTPLPPFQPCPRAPTAAFSPKGSPGSRRSLQGVPTRVNVDISERRGEGAGERGAGAWRKKRRERARMQVRPETEHTNSNISPDGYSCHPFCACQGMRNGQCFLGTNQGRNLSHRRPPYSRWPTCRAGRGKACRPRSPLPRRPHASPPPAARGAAAQTWTPPSLGSLFLFLKRSWRGGTEVGPLFPALTAACSEAALAGRARGARWAAGPHVEPAGIITFRSAVAAPTRRQATGLQSTSAVL